MRRLRTFTASSSRKKFLSKSGPSLSPGDVPADERSEIFKSALERARVSDIEYIVKREALESEGREDETAVAILERELREKFARSWGYRRARLEKRLIGLRTRDRSESIPF